MWGQGRGYTLYEVMITLVIAGIVMSFAVPRMDGVIRRERVHSAMNRLASDLEFMRMEAIHQGSSTVLRFDPGPGCPRPGGIRYRIRLKGSVQALRESYSGDAVVVCYAMGGADSLVYTSRGILAPFNNRTIRGVLGNARDSLTVSVAGRVYRRW